MQVLMYSVCYFCSILTKLQFPGQIIIKLSCFANISKYSGKLFFESRNRPFVAQRVPGGLGSQISMTFST